MSRSLGESGFQSANTEASFFSQSPPVVLDGEGKIAA